MDPAAVALPRRDGSGVVDAGPIGAGAALRLGINVMTYAQFAAVGAGFDVVVREGGSTESLVDALRHLGQLGMMTETFLLLASMPSEERTEEIMEIVRSSAVIADKDLALTALLAGTEAYREFLTGVRCSIPEVFGVAGEGEEAEPGGEA
jgi:3-hydroxyisobutyrate dehydrogenase-like beta-hydroxyacid dehydrogenase